MLEKCVCKCHLDDKGRPYEDYGFTSSEFWHHMRLGKFVLVGYDKKDRQLWKRVGAQF